ncbi:MAG: hypothetical protein A2521_16560 [Deltaproteobacteria bacterium RIFOXYD12_FULL_57_12]|nr:MAG: hypothetical protein A2521_16560 [Deltaproteobacteria bacterium RIFOXYD12_FULL_57_12]
MRHVESLGNRLASGLARPATPRSRATGFEATLRHQEQRLRNTPTPTAANDKTAPAAASGEAPIYLGRISGENPTVSHLLSRDSRFSSQCWSIIYAKANQEKSFTAMQSGTAVYLDPKTKEITWEQQSPATPAVAASQTTTAEPAPDTPTAAAAQPLPAMATEEQAADPASTEFDAAMLPEMLQPYVGTPYSRLNCFELVVKGLTKMGVSYNGKGGLQQELIQRAINDKLPSNAYLTGEGLIAASGSPVYEKTVRPGSDPKAAGEEMFTELKEHLRPGQLLSFSTRRRGHTGVISRQGDTWTFLNSGRSDNTLKPAANRKGVAEEDLKAEIVSWLRRARSAGESLQVTVGQLNHGKLLAYMK